jgi:polysaccharide export outer membrane protein
MEFRMTYFRRFGGLSLALATLFAAAVPAQAQQRQRTGSSALPASAQPQQGYILGPNDSITVVVYGQTEFNVQTKVKPDGSISLPLVGRVEAAGRTVVTLADEVARQLTSRNLLREPIVNVEITEYGSRFVRVAGKVGAPGLVPLDRPYRMLDILLRSGWVRDEGATYVVLRRAGQPEQLVNTADLARGDPARDPLIEAGDTIFVPDADLVYLLGAVSRPGAFALRPGQTIRELIALAGGVTAAGSADKVRVRRGGREIEANSDTALQRGDQITVRERLF